VIQIPPQGRFAGRLAIIPPDGQPGVVIQAIVGPEGPAPGPGVPALPAVNPVAPIPAPIVPNPPAPINPLAGTQSHGQNAVIIAHPDHGYQWAQYFSEENCPHMNHRLEMAMQTLMARMKDHKVNQEAAGLTTNHAVRFAITHHIQTTQYHDQERWGAMVRHLCGPSQVGGIRGRRHTNQKVRDFLTGANLALLRQIQSRAY
jgi:hypothetical protein